MAPGVRSPTNRCRAPNLPHTSVCARELIHALLIHSEYAPHDQLPLNTDRINRILTSVHSLRYTIAILYLFDICFLADAIVIQALDQRPSRNCLAQILGRCCYLVFETAIDKVEITSRETRAGLTGTRYLDGCRW